jgi:c-di-GMP-binding flagellar brake protein YcgR
MPSQALPARAKRKRGERRAAIRLVPPQEIVCYWSSDGKYARARVYDISAGGVCMLVNRRLEPGAVLAVELINGPHTFLCARTLRVVRVFKGAGKDSVIGGQFDRRLTYDELLPFLL